MQDEGEDGSHERAAPAPTRGRFRPVRTWRGWGPAAPAPSTDPCLRTSLSDAVDQVTRTALSLGPVGRVGLEREAPFAAGEEMRTEVSAKFRRAGVEAELAAAGLTLTHWWTDPVGDFGLSLSVPGS